MRRPELHPELLIRRRAILTAIRSRSSYCSELGRRNLRSQSLAWHNVAGLCLMHFPRFRKTLASPLNVASCPYFASADKIALSSPNPRENAKKRWTPSKAAIPGLWTFMSETWPNNSQRSQPFCRAIPFAETASFGQATDMNVHRTKFNDGHECPSYVIYIGFNSCN